MRFLKSILPAFAGVLLAAVAFAGVTSLWTANNGQIDFPLTPTTIGDPIKGGMAPVNGSLSYTKTIPLTAFSLTFGDYQQEMILVPAGTLAAGTITLAANPVDGARNCFFSTQIITALTLNANTGQTVNNAVTAGTANGRFCYLYSSSNKTWDRD